MRVGLDGGAEPGGAPDRLLLPRLHVVDVVEVHQRDLVRRRADLVAGVLGSLNERERRNINSPWP